MFPVGVSLATAATIAAKNVKGDVLKLIVVVDIRNARQRHEVGGVTKSQGGHHGIRRQNAGGTLISEEA